MVYFCTFAEQREHGIRVVLLRSQEKKMAENIRVSTFVQGATVDELYSSLAVATYNTLAEQLILHAWSCASEQE